jgi:hypothetical protein
VTAAEDAQAIIIHAITIAITGAAVVCVISTRLGLTTVVQVNVGRNAQITHKRFHLKTAVTAEYITSCVTALIASGHQHHTLPAHQLQTGDAQQ